MCSRQQISAVPWLGLGHHFLGKWAKLHCTWELLFSGWNNAENLHQLVELIRKTLSLSAKNCQQLVKNGIPLLDHHNAQYVIYYIAGIIPKRTDVFVWAHCCQAGVALRISLTFVSRLPRVGAEPHHIHHIPALDSSASKQLSYFHRKIMV